MRYGIVSLLYEAIYNFYIDVTKYITWIIIPDVYIHTITFEDGVYAYCPNIN